MVETLHSRSELNALSWISRLWRRNERASFSGGVLIRFVLAIFSVAIIGAAVWVTIIFKRQAAAYHHRTVCVGNLTRIRLAKSVVALEIGLTNGSSVPEGALWKIARQGQESCPAGGAYLIGPVRSDPQCTFTGVCHTWHFDRETKRIQRRDWRHKLEFGAP